MLFDALFDPDSEGGRRRVERLEGYYRSRYSLVVWVLLAGFVAFVAWAQAYRIDQVARASGEVIASSRVQLIQAVDGGVLAELHVREGDTVRPGQVLARLEQKRSGASVAEIAARLCALKAQRARLAAEVTGAKEVRFPQDMTCPPEQLELERSLFKQRRVGLQDELANLDAGLALARDEAAMVQKHARAGDVSQAEVIRAQKALRDAEAKVIVRRNRFFEEANAALAKAEDEIAQNEQVLSQRNEQLVDSVFEAQVSGIVKNIRVTTRGGVLRAGEELMQIVPIDDELLIEAKVSPADIALVRPGLDAHIRFDPFDYTLFGAVRGEVRYVSADTLKEETRQGEEIYYRVHVAIDGSPVTTTTGRELEILPGMTAQLDIRTGDRTVMDYLLKPLRRTVATAFGER